MTTIQRISALVYEMSEDEREQILEYIDTMGGEDLALYDDLDFGFIVIAAISALAFISAVAVGIGIFLKG